MYARFLTASLYGLTGEKTWVEVDCENGMPTISMVGLANQSVKEAKERIRSAISNCGFDFPARKITVNLTPANKQKSGNHYDLPIALGVLNSTGLLLLKDKKTYQNGDTAFFGELTLDGRLNPIDGALPMILGLKRSGVKNVFLPKKNLAEAMLVKDLLLYPAETLKEVVDHIISTDKISAVRSSGYVPGKYAPMDIDFADIRGQETVKRAAQIAASGMHGMLMIGPPGVGKTMVGKRIPGILPPLTYEEQLDTTQIYSIAGELTEERPMITERPFRAPHHSMSAVALVGGGRNIKPGEISLAHNGVLFLDELPEFSVYSLDMLRQPMEDGFIAVNRVGGKTVYPSRFMLIAAMNPCKCGFYGDPVKPCTCSQSERQRYISKISGPLLDRIDIHVSMNRIVYEDITGNPLSGLSTARLREGVETAMEMQKNRYKKTEGLNYNSQLPPSLVERYCGLNKECKDIMKNAFETWDLSARSYHRILKVARTIADVDASEEILAKHLLEALSYRMPDSFK